MDAAQAAHHGPRECAFGNVHVPLHVRESAVPLDQSLTIPCH